MKLDDPMLRIRSVLAPLFAYNNEKEQDALNGYYQLRDTIKDLMDEYPLYTKMLKPMLEQIEEHIGDELNHSYNNLEMMIEVGQVKEKKDEDI